MLGTLNPGEVTQLQQTIEMFEVICQSQPQDYQSLEILKESYSKLGNDAKVVETSKRIAKAYVELGQLSSAILEFETILQRHPDDADARAAMAEIENKANNLSNLPPAEPEPVTKTSTTTTFSKKGAQTVDIDDGRQAMYKLFVEGKYLSAGDFDLCWITPDLSRPPAKVMEPFIHLLAEKAMVQMDQSLKLITERSRLGFLPMDRYDVDMDVARSFPKDLCHRWCVLPFDRLSKSVMLATANPFNKQAIADFEQAGKGRLLWYLAPPADLIKMLGKVYR